MPPSKMGRRIKTFRRASGLTQQQLAERARVTQSFVAKLENETGAACPWPRFSGSRRPSA